MDQSKDISLIPGYERFTNYDIDITGKMRNCKTNRHLTGHTRDGYCIFTLKQDGFRKGISVNTALKELFGIVPEHEKKSRWFFHFSMDEPHI
jgi:hypothetical protein